MLFVLKYQGMAVKWTCQHVYLARCLRKNKRGDLIMKQYTIGDVSKRLGISRDSLRFYEKKGIITPQKLENGYRCYSYEDTRKLLDIMFYRRLNFSIEGSGTAPAFFDPSKVSYSAL